MSEDNYVIVNQQTTTESFSAEDNCKQGKSLMRLRLIPTQLNIIQEVILLGQAIQL